MKRIAIFVVLLGLAGQASAAGLQQRPERALRPNAVRPNANRLNAAQRSLVEDAVLGFYVNQFRQAEEITPEAFAKILPFLQQFIHDRFEISQRRVRALNQLRQAIARNAGDDELKPLVQQLDAADAEFQNNQEKFFGSVDPLLNARQQARIRILQNLADNRIRQALNAVQNGAGQRQNRGAEN